MNQVHKENLTHVENANPGRQGLEIEIFGMEGVPAEIIDQHNQQVTQAHFAEEAERARVTGNPVRGLYANGTAPPNKRPKVTESLEEIEARADKYREDRKNGVLPLPPATAEVVEVCYSPCGYNRAMLTMYSRHNHHSTPPKANPFHRPRTAAQYRLVQAARQLVLCHRVRASTLSSQASTTSLRAFRRRHQRRRKRARRTRTCD